MNFKRAGIWSAAVLLTALTAATQEPTPAGKMPDSAAPADTSKPGASVTNMLSGELMDSPYSPLHWGRISVLSLSANQYYDFNYAFDNANQRDARATELSALLVFTIQKGKLAFDVQYRPAVWFTDSGNSFDLSNQMFDGHMSFQVKPRWTMTLSDSFISLPFRGAVAESGLVSIASSGSLLTNPFLATEQRVTSNQVSWMNTYDLGGRDKLTFGAEDEYQGTSRGSVTTPAVIGPGSNGLASSLQDIVGMATYVHTYSSRTTGGVAYTYDYETFGPVIVHSQRHSIAPTFSRVLGHDFRFSGSLGYTYVTTHSQLAGLQGGKSYIGSAAVQKSIHRSELALDWTRSNQFTGLISNGLNDRFDFSVTHPMGRRLQLSAQMGYLSQQLSGRASAHSWTGTSSARYSLDRHWSLMTSFMYLGESGLFNLPYQARKTISFGARWDWGGQKKEIQ